MHIRGFNYIANKSAEIFILGSIPGTESLLQQQYYAHPRNIFWDIMGRIFKFDKKLSYETRLKKLKNNKVALWDIVSKCNRMSSADSK